MMSPTQKVLVREFRVPNAYLSEENLFIAATDPLAADT